MTAGRRPRKPRRANFGALTLWAGIDAYGRRVVQVGRGWVWLTPTQARKARDWLGRAIVWMGVGP